MIKAEAHKDGEGYWVELIDTNNVDGYMKITMEQAEALKFQLETVLYEYDCMVDHDTDMNRQQELF